MLVASAGNRGTPDEVTATENLTVPESGERIIDLILFPSESLDDLSGFTDNNTTPTGAPAQNPTTVAEPDRAAVGEELDPVAGRWSHFAGDRSHLRRPPAVADVKAEEYREYAAGPG